MKVIIEAPNGNVVMEFEIIQDDVNADDIICTENCSIADVDFRGVRIQADTLEHVDLNENM